MDKHMLRKKPCDLKKDCSKKNPDKKIVPDNKQVTSVNTNP